MKLSDLPEPPSTNGDETHAYLIKAVAALIKHAQPKGWCAEQFSLGNVVTLGALALLLAFFYFRTEAHLVDQYQVHWTAAQIDERIDVRDKEMGRPPTADLSRIYASLEKIEARLEWLRSNQDTEWLGLKERTLILEHDAMRAKGQR